MPEVQEQGGQGEAEADTESGAKEAKGGEEMTREEVVQAALTVERWCADHQKETQDCDCPFNRKDGRMWIQSCCLIVPTLWGLEEFLRTMGLKHD